MLGGVNAQYYWSRKISLSSKTEKNIDFLQLKSTKLKSHSEWVVASRQIEIY